MDTTNLSSVASSGIEEGIQYIENNFTKELWSNAEGILDAYRKANQSLNSAQIDVLIHEQEQYLEAIKQEFDSILSIARGNMTSSLETIQNSTNTINNILGQNGLR